MRWKNAYATVLIALTSYVQLTSSSYCSGSETLTAGSGTIVSHSKVGKEKYKNSMDCTWDVVASPGKVIRSWFSFVDLENGYDFVKIYDKMDSTCESDNLLLSTSAVSSCSSIVSSDNSMRIRFTTDGSVTKLGFRLHFEAVDALRVLNSSCRRYQHTIEGSNGTIISHAGFGRINYPNNINSSWYLTVPAGTFVLINFTSLDIHWSSDQLKINYGASTCSGTPITMTSSSLRHFVSSSNKLTVNFKTGNRSTAAGFSATFEAVQDRTDCSQPSSIVADTGVIVSHDGVGLQQHAHNMRCTWNITVSPGKRIHSWFSYLSLETCCDKVELYDRGDAVCQNSKLIGSGKSLCTSFVSATNTMTVKFTSDHSVAKFGFRLNFAAVDADAMLNSSCSRQEQTVEGENGIIVSHSGFGRISYSSNMNSFWYISVPAGKIVGLNFTAVDLDWSNDFVKVYPDLSSCGSVFTLTTASIRHFISESNQMVVSFTTNSNIEGSGFLANFKATEPVTYCTSRQSFVTASSSGTILSHSGAGVTDYKNNMQCKWVVTVPNSEIVKVWFSYKELESCCDKVEVFDSSGLSCESDKLDWTNCSSFFLASNTFTVTFQSDYSVTGKGFRLHFEAVNATDYSNSSCTRRTQIVENTNGTIVSHADFGSEFYSNNLDNYWQIKVPAGKVVKYQFVLLDLQWSHDTVTLYDGDTTCGSVGSRQLSQTDNWSGVCSTNSLIVRLQTDATVGRAGFMLNFEQEDSNYGWRVVAVVAGSVLMVCLLALEIVLIVGFRRRQQMESLLRWARPTSRASNSHPETDNSNVEDEDQYTTVD